MSRSDRILVAAGGGAVVLAAIAVAIVLVPVASPGTSPSADPAAGLLVGTPAAAPPFTPAASGAVATGTIFVDVEGAVAKPGIRELPAGSRVADAIDAAGGYAPDADLEAKVAALTVEQVRDAMNRHLDVNKMTFMKGGDFESVSAGAGGAP